jgi:hypothetical protein
MDLSGEASELRYAWVKARSLFCACSKYKGDGYRLPLDVAAIAGTDTFRFALEQIGGFQEYRFPAVQSVMRVLIDPDYWVLKTLQ